jgi:ribosomal protein S18 acetylase RimI-like enzyme
MAKISQVLNQKSNSSKRSAMISFRRATLADRAFLLTLRKNAMDQHLQLAGIYLDDNAHLKRIDEYFADSHLILIENDSIGLLKLGLFPDKIHVRQFQLLPAYQGLGIGGRVLDLVKTKAQEKQIDITLNVLLHNPAKTLYLRHGFMVTERNALEFKMRWQCQH